MPDPETHRASVVAERDELRERCAKGADWLMRVYVELRELKFDLPHVLLTEDGVTTPGTTFNVGLCDALDVIRSFRAANGWENPR